MTQSGPRIKRLHRQQQVGEVNGLEFPKIQAHIQWTGTLKLHQTGELAESFLSDLEWPKKSGIFYFVCASTGLLFDKQSGACRQASTVTLRVDTVVPTTCSARAFGKWLKDKYSGGFNGRPAKRGPKPKGSKPPEGEEGGEDEFD